MSMVIVTLITHVTHGTGEISNTSSMDRTANQRQSKLFIRDSNCEI